MERGAATRGKVAKAIEGAATIEIKATIPDHQVRLALARFSLTARNDEERYIYFFDTPNLELLGAGIITRARRVVGDDHDCTVKFRPIEPQDVGPKWRKYRDFKIEADASEGSMVKSASFSMPVPKGHIKRVALGKKPIAAIFSAAQEEFLGKFAGLKVDFSRLVVLGPLTAQRWRFEDPACPWPITAELWTRGDRKQMMELSIKVPAIQAAAGVGGFMAFLAEVGAERDKNQQAKTRWALDYYVGKIARPPPRKSLRRQEILLKKRPGKTAQVVACLTATADAARPASGADVFAPRIDSPHVRQVMACAGAQCAARQHTTLRWFGRRIVGGVSRRYQSDPAPTQALKTSPCHAIGPRESEINCALPYGHPTPAPFVQYKMSTTQCHKRVEEENPPIRKILQLGSMTAS